MTNDEPTRQLLSDVFVGSDVADSAYLEWLYRASPFGQVVEANIDDADGRAAHYALVPCRFASPRDELTIGLSLNTAVAERARGGGVFSRIAEQTLDAARDGGYVGAVGVANANSTPGFLRRLGFTLLGALPATVIVPRPGRGTKITSNTVKGAALGADPRVRQILSDAPRRADGITPTWTPETLAWRLSSPRNYYVVHRGDGLVAVSVAEQRGGARFAVLLAIFADHDVDGAEFDALVRAACRRHGAPLALHVGRNPRVAIRGIPLPTRLRPSPLNLIFRWLDDQQLAAPHVGRFEFLDFDAY